MSTKPPDDFEAVRSIVEALTPFEPKDQERIIRWAREKVGLTVQQDSRIPIAPVSSGSQAGSAPPFAEVRSKDIRSFIENKSPQSDNQFAAAVAYYHRFEAPESERKTTIGSDDLQEATRQAGRARLNSPGQTLLNAHGQGYFDKAERGRYALNTVGENLVAMALPQGPAKSARPAAGAKRRKATKPKSKRRATPKKK